MLLEPPAPDTLGFVIDRMREVNRREVSAVRDLSDRDGLITACLAGGDFAWIAGTPRCGPVAAIGAFPTHPGYWQAWMFATDDFGAVSFSLTRWCLRVMIPALKAAGAHRVECRSIVKPAVWLEFMGFEFEGTMKRYGRNREDFHLYALEP